METIPFEQWWREFLQEHRHDKDGGYCAVDDLERWTRRRSAEVQMAFRRELVDVAVCRTDGWGLAVAALEQLASDDDRQQLWSRSAEHLFEGEEDRHVRNLAGPPYSVAECVFDEYDLDGCSLDSTQFQ